ncbi:DASH family cryptochrome [Muricauda brasiliensis]|uniref:DASH family cryptochrome n=1 Tax=Muricauda brasiliensis TaxID=2162892 RepID=UPI000D3AD105|nr:DASH family cryptochrome [Muricauda brasiliensis]
MKTNLIWFGNNLRVQDNEALLLSAQTDRLIAVYFFDPRNYQIGPFGFKKTECFRAKFLLESVHQLQKNLEKLNITLLVFHEKPEDKIPELVEQFNINHIFLQHEWISEENQVIQNVQDRLPKTVSLRKTFDQFLFHPEDIPFDSYSQIPQVFTVFRKKCEKHVQVRPCFEKPKVFPKENRIGLPKNLPSLHDLGFSPFDTDHRSAFPFIGGENDALHRMQHYFWDTKKLAYYKKTRNGLVGTDYSSKFSPWLANGSISARTIYWEVKRFETEVQKNQDTYWLIFELIWRDYFKYVSLKHGNQIFKIDGILQKEYDWHSNEAAKSDWINGETDDDFVNANMIELKNTGWMSNRGRQNVASYWSKHLLQDWRIGASYFEAMLIDYDVHSNWGNWMYNSGVGNDPRNRTFNTKRQAEHYDPNKKFQSLWLQPTLF